MPLNLFAYMNKIDLSISPILLKSYLPNWSEETFTVAQRIARDPPVYKLKELDGELIKGTFYETELQKVIEKVLRRRGKGGQAEVLVHWKGWPKKYDSWIPARQ